jgi:hypothetical protein
VRDSQDGRRNSQVPSVVIRTHRNRIVAAILIISVS